MSTNNRDAAVTNVAIISIDEAEGRAVAAAIERLDHRHDHRVLTPSMRATLNRFLANPLGPALRELRHPDGVTALIIDGLPFVDGPGPTVSAGERWRPMPITTAILTWLVETMGVFLVGYPSVAGGNVVHDAGPGPIEGHRPDFVLLWAVEPWSAGYAAIGPALELLPDETVTLLRAPRYRIDADATRSPAPASSPVLRPLVSGPRVAPEIVLPAGATTCLDAGAAGALAELLVAIDRVTVDLDLMAGRLLLLDNRRGVYRCRPTTTVGPSPGIALIRSYLVSDPWAERRAFLAGQLTVNHFGHRDV